MRPIFILKDQANYSFSTAHKWGETLAEAFKHSLQTLEIGFEKTINDDPNQAIINIPSLETLSHIIEEKDASMLIIELSGHHSIQHYLDNCRTLRIPYLIVKPSHTIINLSKIALPVSFLIEDKEKGPFASAFGRFFGSEILIYVPKDYGSKARQNIDAMKLLFDSFNLSYREINGRKNSAGIEREAALAAPEESCGLTIISASREYGLDDILFGSKEKRILKQSDIPLLLINPRDDLYALCD